MLVGIQRRKPLVIEPSGEWIRVIGSDFSVTQKTRASRDMFEDLLTAANHDKEISCFFSPEEGLNSSYIILNNCYLGGTSKRAMRGLLDRCLAYCPREMFPYEVEAILLAVSTVQTMHFRLDDLNLLPQ